ncbi:neutral cholesterol ester hydrolase 1-like [Acanthaster planci]|uniref:Neutral cholesterol ester hydrolase 1-like n=1 Tax=Acanthaster planci TaxID=133434 RepID=A0A8B7ZAQ1_ACAPL|nr:neutral cholesterol ester hydrolase 1-like [Acanthaster planci]
MVNEELVCLPGLGLGNHEGKNSRSPAVDDCILCGQHQPFLNNPFRKKQDNIKAHQAHPRPTIGTTPGQKRSCPFAGLRNQVRKRAFNLEEDLMRGKAPDCLKGINGTPFIPTGIVEWLDERTAANLRGGGPGVPYRDTVFDRVPVRIFTDEQAGGETSKQPAIVLYHGGGFIWGSPDSHHALASQIARELKAVFISVDYRLAPKHPFPAAIDDCTAAAVWFLEHLSDYNVDPARVAIMGDSAGGNLAAATAQRLTFDQRYRDLPKVKLQVLIYPVLQGFDFQTPSYQWNGHYPTLLNKVLMTWMIDLYINGRKGGPRVQDAMQINSHTSAAAKRTPLVQRCLSHDLVPDEFKQSGYEAPSTNFGDEDVYDEIKGALWNPDFAPLMQEDLRGLPEAYILTAEYDVLRDDGIMYAKRLEKAGVPVTLKDYLRGFHGMFGTGDSCFMACTPMGDQSFWDFIAFAKKRL